MEPAEIATAIGVELVGRLPHGEGTGAYEVRLADGSDAVLKLFLGDVLDLGATTALTDALRDRGYPVPAVIAAGEIEGRSYELQERVRGVPMEQPTSAHLAAIFELVRLQREIGLPGRGPWGDQMITSLRDGFDGYCELDALREHSDETRALLERLHRIASRAGNVEFRDDDIVHYDFSAYNLHEVAWFMGIGTDLLAAVGAE